MSDKLIVYKRTYDLKQSDSFKPLLVCNKIPSFKHDPNSFHSRTEIGDAPFHRNIEKEMSENVLKLMSIEELKNKRAELVKEYDEINKYQKLKSNVYMKANPGCTSYTLRLPIAFWSHWNFIKMFDKSLSERETDSQKESDDAVL